VGRCQCENQQAWAARALSALKAQGYQVSRKAAADMVENLLKARRELAEWEAQRWPESKVSDA